MRTIQNNPDCPAFGTNPTSPCANSLALLADTSKVGGPDILSPAEKCCPGCKKTKPIVDFYKDICMKGGFSCWCKSCHLGFMKKYRDTNKAKIKIKRKEYYENNRELVAKYNRNYIASYPERRSAHRKTHRARRSGNLVPQPCSVCGSTENIQAHHDRYDRPLEVRWLCSVHHAQHHATLRTQQSLEAKP